MRLERRLPQSAELAGGAGHTFEDKVAAQYLAAMLAEVGAPGIADRDVIRVALQQRDFGEPLDDLIVDFRSAQDEARLSLQLKRSLTISSAVTNSDFADIVRDAWLTLQKPDFRIDVDRFGAATESVAFQKRRDLSALCDFARASGNLADFERRFRPDGNASVSHSSIREEIADLIERAKGSPPSPTELFVFLRHFVLLVFDHLHDAATDPAEAIALLAPALAPQQADRASLVWDRLCSLARKGAGRSQQFVRRDLVVVLIPIVRLSGRPSLRADLAILTTFARNSILDIEDDVGGTTLDRPKLRQDLADARELHRFVQVQGLPGAGKSALLRLDVQQALLEGPVLFLKSDRLHGTSWLAFARGLGLGIAAIEDLLVEIAGTGTPTVFIDGIDRVELAQRAIILDIARAIIASPELAGWKIVATLRDTGVEHLRTWLPHALFEENTVGVVRVEQLDADESRALAEVQPALKPLLFGPRAVREIVRRPFFAKILAQNFASAQGADAFMPRSEIDLVENWWRRGGYDAGGQLAINRRLALLDLAIHRARNPSAPIVLTELRPDTVQLIEQLVVDGILQTGRDGVTVRFAHDIFFEWAYFHRLVIAGDGWIAELKDIGEPPMIGRIVDLLAQAKFAAGDGWAQSLRQLEASALRSQWLRAWLLGPLASPIFDENEAQFLEIVMAEDCRLFRRLMVWFQAERTIPNPAILKGDAGSVGISLERRIQAADLFGWPSDFATWDRLTELLLRKCGELPAHLIPQIASIFEVWQNALADIPNQISKSLLAQADQWLRSLEERTARKGAWLTSKAAAEEKDQWSSLRGGTKELASDLRRLVLRGSRAEPALTRSYLQHLLDEKEPLRDIIDEILAYSPLLSQTHPAELADVTQLHLCQELPAEVAARHEREEKAASALRMAALDKPEEERSRNEQLAAEGMFSRIGFDSISTSDWDSLALDDHGPDYFPASPLKEPFRSLFEYAPSEALRLLRQLSNHAMTAWRQLFQLDWQRPGTPIPLEIGFPWGKQYFWGSSREYLWSRGIWAPKALACAWLAAENWALAELERGTDPNSLIRQIVEGNESIASLAVAVAIARQANVISDTVQPILESPRVWRADIRRGREEISFKTSSLIGFAKEIQRPHALAVDEINKRRVREGDIRDLVGSYVLLNSRSEKMRAAIRRFSAEPEYDFEEYRNEPGALEDLASFAASMERWADLANYHAVKVETGDRVEAIYFVDPETSMPEAHERQAKARAVLTEQALFVWAQKSLESGSVDQMFSYSAAIEHAQRIDREGSVSADQWPDAASVAWGGVAGAAAVALRFREASSEDERVWARGLLARVVKTSEPIDPSWSSMSVIPWHAGIFAARGLAADLRNGLETSAAGEDLLRLVAHPLEVVALAALESLFALFDMEPHLAWAGLCLAFDLCVLPPRGRTMSPEGYRAVELERRTAALSTAVAARASADWRIPATPDAPWTFVPGAKSSRRARIPTSQDFAEVEIVEDGAWRPAGQVWHSQFAAKIVRLVPIVTVLDIPGPSESFRTFVRTMLEWTIESIAPSWDPDGRDSDRRSAQIYEWRDDFARQLGRIAGHLSADLVEHDLLAPIVSLRTDPCFSLLAPFVDMFLRAHVMDAETVAPSSTRVMKVALDRLLSWRGFDRTSYRPGELHGFDLPMLLKALMFVASLNAPRARRFANGDWTDIALILPTVDRFVRAAGWAPTVMTKYLKLCEHAREAYPADQFADQVLSILSLGDEALRKWHGSMLPARIASLVQMYADAQSPMPSELGESLLRILDILVDQGDRRSAALQLTEAFREIKLPSNAA